MKNKTIQTSEEIHEEYVNILDNCYTYNDDLSFIESVEFIEFKQKRWLSKDYVIKLIDEMEQEMKKKYRINAMLALEELKSKIK